jgi:hypothetical protein
MPGEVPALGPEILPFPSDPELGSLPQATIIAPVSQAAAGPAVRVPRPDGYALKDSDQHVLYDYMRKEVEREDRLTHERLTTLCSFQGFLIAGVGLLLSSGWTPDMPTITVLRKGTIAVIGVWGIIVGLSSHISIHASRKSLSNAKKRWEIVSKEIDLDARFPQTHGERNVFLRGSIAAHVVPLSFTGMWGLFLIGCLILFHVGHPSVLVFMPASVTEWLTALVKELAQSGGA